MPIPEGPLRTYGVECVLDWVRKTGKSAHPVRVGEVSPLVEYVSILYGFDPHTLQSEVKAYADWRNGLNRV